MAAELSRVVENTDDPHEKKRALRQQINQLDRAIDARLRSTIAWIDRGEEADEGHARRVLHLIRERDRCKGAEERLGSSPAAQKPSTQLVSPPGRFQINFLSFCLIYTCFIRVQSNSEKEKQLMADSCKSTPLWMENEAGLGTCVTCLRVAKRRPISELAQPWWG